MRTWQGGSKQRLARRLVCDLHGSDTGQTVKHTPGNSVSYTPVDDLADLTGPYFASCWGFFQLVVFVRGPSNVDVRRAHGVVYCLGPKTAGNSE